MRAVQRARYGVFLVIEKSYSNVMVSTTLNTIGTFGCVSWNSANVKRVVAEPEAGSGARTSVQAYWSTKSMALTRVMMVPWNDRTTWPRRTPMRHCKQRLRSQP